MPRLRTDFDPYGEHATARKWLATRAKPWLRPVCNAIVAYAQGADEQADRLTRIALALKSPDLLARAYKWRERAQNADYLLFGDEG